MTSKLPTAHSRRCLWLVLLLFCCALPVGAQAQEKNRLLRIKVRPHHGFTRITLLFRSPPDYTLSRGTGRVRISLRETDAPLFKKLRSYSDANVAGVFCSARRGGVQVTVPIKSAGRGVELIDFVSPTALALDIGPALKRQPQVDIVPGREPILSGTERFVRDFATPAPAALPFVPTDQLTLKRLLPEAEQALFRAGESALYKEQGSAALPVFAAFLSKPAEVKALASYRMAQAYYLLERYDEALKAYQQGAALWPDYPEQAPELLQTCADLKARGGDFAGGRALLVRLVDRMAGTAYVGPLVNRLADLTARHGDQAAALELYRSVVQHAPGTPAFWRARMKLADRDMFTLPRDSYQSLLERYQEIYQAPCDFPLRDEALFKVALLQALYGPAREALAASITYQNRYPRGIFATIVKKMREELIWPVYREVYASRNDAALVQLALDNKEYLSRCLGDPEFAPRLAEACRKAGKPAEELALFGYLSERSWAGSSASFMVARLVEGGLAQGNLPLAQASARSFLSRFPRDPRGPRMHERLGRIAFEQGDLKQVAQELSFLNGKGRKAELPESDYYLGKALAEAGNLAGAERALSRFSSAPPEGTSFMSDTYSTLAAARVALKQYPGALAAYREGLKYASGELTHQYLYKMGELYLQLNRVREAKAAWQEVAQKGGTWGKLAGESLNDLNWRLKIAAELPGSASK